MREPQYCRAPEPHESTELLRTATVGRPDARHQVLAFMGILACIEPFELQRFRLLCDEWDAQITLVDTPGYGYGGGRLAPAERRGLRRGDFTTLAQRMVQAAQRFHDPLCHKSVTIVGYSMGASLASAAAAHADLPPVRALVLVEPVAIRRWSIPRLICAVRSEESALQICLDDNSAWPHAVLPVQRRHEARPARSRVDLAHLGFGLSRGQMTRDLLRAGSIHSCAVHVVHGTDSRLCTLVDVATLTSICRRTGMIVHDVAVHGRHPLWHSLRNARAIAQFTQPNLAAES